MKSSQGGKRKREKGRKNERGRERKGKRVAPEGV